MSYLADPGTFWLNVTNIVLGATTLILVSLFIRSVFRDVLQHRKSREHDRVS